jgi:2,3-bisphosphoglycerate-dependent phosphoglycerate mutase
MGFSWDCGRFFISGTNGKMTIDPAILTKYPKARVEEAIALLTYKHVDPMPKTEIPGVPTLYIFRHGETSDNANFLFSGWRDADLTEKGVEQAKVLAEKMKDKNVQMLISSDLKRAVRTMEIAMSLNPSAKRLEIIQDPRIRERKYGDLQGTSKLLLQLENPELAHLDRRGYDHVPPNGESLAMVVERVTDFIEDITAKMRQFQINVAVSCHGNSIRGFRQYFGHLTNEQTAALETSLAQDYAAYAIK